MKNAIVLLAHLLAGLAILLGTGGTRAYARRIPNSRFQKRFFGSRATAEGIHHAKHPRTRIDPNTGIDLNE
jgi:hypothetical protein